MTALAVGVMIPARQLDDALGVRLTKLDDDQAEYLGVPPGGPYKAEQYRY